LLELWIWTRDRWQTSMKFLTHRYQSKGKIWDVTLWEDIKCIVYMNIVRLISLKMNPIIKLILEFHVKPRTTLDQHKPTSYPVDRLSCRRLTSRVTEISSVVSPTERATVQAAWEDYHITPCFMLIVLWMHKEVPIRTTLCYLFCIHHKCVREVTNSVV
jgi:hypothetical protein